MLVFQRFLYFARGGFAKFDRSDLAKLLGVCSAAGSQTTVFAGGNELWPGKTSEVLPRKNAFAHGGKSARRGKNQILRIPYNRETSLIESKRRIH